MRTHESGPLWESQCTQLTYPPWVRVSTSKARVDAHQNQHIMMIIDVLVCAIQITYCQGPYDEASGFANLQETLQGFETAASAKTVGRLFYLALPPQVYPDVLSNIKQHCSDFSSGDGDCKPETWLRVVIEKPFGHDLASSEELSDTVAGLFAEQQIYRIDHFLGKEVTQVHLWPHACIRVLLATVLAPQHTPRGPSQHRHTRPMAVSCGPMSRPLWALAETEAPCGRYVHSLSEGPGQRATYSPCSINKQCTLCDYQQSAPLHVCTMATLCWPCMLSRISTRWHMCRTCSSCASATSSCRRCGRGSTSTTSRSS